MLLGWEEVLLQLFWLLHDIAWEEERRGETAGGKEIFIQLQKQQMVAMEGKVHMG